METADEDTETPGLWTSRGTAQEDRLPDPLREDYILPFERSFEEEIAVAARLIQWISPPDQSSSFFQSLIASEPAIALAEIIAFAENSPHAHSFNNLSNTLKDTKTEKDNQIISTIAERFNRLKLSEDNRLHSLYDLLPATIHKKTVSADAYEASLIESLPRQLPTLRTLLASRLESGEIDPALGLLIATIKVLIDTKSRLNRFPDELLDHYYSQQLGILPKPQSPVVALLTTSANKNPVPIPKDTQLTAFITDDLKVSGSTIANTRAVAATVQKVAHVRYWRDRTLAPVNIPGMITGVGAEQITDRGVRLFSPRQTPSSGLHIESPVLSLAQGKREIDLQIKLTPHQYSQETETDQLEKVIESVARNPTIQSAFEFSTVDAAVDTITNAVKRFGKLADTDQPTDLVQTALHEFINKEFKFKNIIHRIVADSFRTNEQKEIDDIGQLDDAIAAVARDTAVRSAFNFTNIEVAVEVITELATKLGYISGTNSLSDRVLAALLQHASDEPQVKVILQRIVADVLLSKDHRWPAKEFLDIIIKATTKLGLPDLLTVIGNHNPDDLFHMLLGDAFSAELSSETGPIAPTSLYVSACSKGSAGIRFRILLDASAPPVTAAVGHTAPYIQIKLAPDARYSPLSLFDERVLESIDIHVTAKGLTRLTAFNDEGPVAVSQTVLPFGTQAKDNSELLVGCPELATKSVESVRLTYTLTDLPPLPRDGSLDSHYDGYGTAFRVPDPKVVAHYLNADGWVPISDSMPLIRGARISSALHRKGVIEGHIASPNHAPFGDDIDIDFSERHAIRSGLLRVRLNTSGRNFGNDTYPLALANAIRKNFLPLREQVTINPPLTIKFTDLTLDYSARSHISINAPAPASCKEKVVQLCPFGERRIYPDNVAGIPSFFPQRPADGSLYIGIGPRISAGPVSLLFDLDNSGCERLAGAINTIQWQILTQDGWRLISGNSLLSDSTAGLQRSGVITFDLPPDIDWESTEMPAGMCWLLASTNQRLNTFPILNSVVLNGIEVHTNPPSSQDIQFARWAFDPAIAGLSEVSGVSEIDNISTAIDSKTQHRTRIAEGLRHRQRGVHAWDIERIVLDAFPAVWKCKCFTARDGLNAAVRAGQITLVVIPHAPSGASIASTTKMFDSPTLLQIKQHVQKRISAFTDVTVRNPSFERLQVRALVTFDQSAGSGALVNKLNKVVSNQLSAWTAEGPMADLGWSLNIDDLASFVESKPYVVALKSFEILHLIHLNAENSHTQSDSYKLHDSVSTHARAISYREIWSLPLAMEHHLITPTEPEAIWNIKPAGIGQLAVGQTLLVDNTANQSP